MDIVALGELLIDFATVDAGADGYPTLRAQPGGAPANVLGAAAACGASTAMIAKVGDDAFGRRLRATLASRGIDVSGVLVDPSRFTTLAFVTIDDDGERSFSFARKPGADTALRDDELPLALIEGARIFHFGSLSLTDEPARTATRMAVAAAQAAEALVSFDPNYRTPLWGDDEAARAAMEWGLRASAIVKLSEEDATFRWGCDAEEATRRLIEDYGCELVFCTLGAEGALAATPEVAVRVTPTAVSPVDTTGAGDIFTGAALAALLRCDGAPRALTEAELETIVRFACAVASDSTTRPGGLTSIPASIPLPL